ncbi:MAG TPA: DUF642 domain-containing protein [Chthoniobacterales bacterium]|nr:DUF642 domain-containing protein [Chthoniobacterales bacterium]
MHFAPRPPGRLAALCLALVTAASVHGQIQNGSFENDYSGWTASGHQGIAQNDPNHPATAGSKVVVLNANDQSTNAILSQTFSTTPGQRYELSFDYGCVGPISDQRLQVILEGSGILYDQVIEISAPYTQPFYVPQHITFTANSANTKLTFLDAAYTYVVLDSMLDNVQVTAVSANAPLITSHPQRTFAPQGGTATFAVAASNATSYQWQFDGVNIPGANSSSYLVSNADSSKAGNYSVIVTNATASVSSSAATLTVVPAGILLNGSFEYGSAAWTYTGVNTSTSTNTGYGVTDGVVLTHFNWGQATPGGTVFQSFTTTSSETYVVDFDLGAFSFVSTDAQSCRVTVTDVNNAILATQDFSVNAAANGGRYQSKQLTFIANGSVAKLTFRDISTTTVNIDLLLDNVRVRLQNAPLITSQPQNKTALTGDSVTFSVTAVGQAPLHYQWRHNDGVNWQPVGTDSSTLTIPSAQHGDAGLYDVIVSNGSGTANSSPATLTVITPGVFSNGSFESDYAAWTVTGNQQVVSGSPFSATDGTKTVAFNVGNQPPNGTLSQSFTTTVGHTYTLTFDAGAFSLVNLSEMRMQVKLQGQGQANPALNRTISVNAPANGTRYVPQSFIFVADSGTTTLTFTDISPSTANADLMLDNVKVTEQPPPGSFTNGSFETGYTGWVVAGNQNIVSSAPFVASDGTKAVDFNGGQTSPNGALSQTFATTGGTNYTLSFDLGAFSQVNHDTMSMLVTIQGQNGQLESQTFTVAAPGNGTFYSPKSLPFTADGSSTTVIFQDVSATTANVDLLLDNVKVLADGGLSISSHPQNTTAQAGGTATFSVTASGQGTLSYQWRFNNGGNWDNIPGANSSTLLIDPVQNSSAGSYDVVVADQSADPPIISSPATLSVLPAGIPANGSFEFDYTGWTASGNQGIINGAPFVASDGAKAVVFNAGDRPPNGILSQSISTNAGQGYILTFDVGAFSLVTHNQQRIQVRVTGNGNSTLLPPQIITVTAPGNGTTYAPQTFNFVADGTSATLIFQDVSQTTSSTDLMLDNVRVTSQAGPLISGQPQNTTASVGGQASFSVTASGTGTVGYQWRFNNGGGWSDIAGADAATYTINSVQNSDAGSYSVVVSDQSGQPSVTSSSATLTILPPGVPSNGSFEFDYAGWTAAGNQAVVTGSPFTATDGVKAVAFNIGNQTPNGTLSQTIPTTNGQAYVLTFDVGAFSMVTRNEQRLQVSVQGAGNTTLLAPQIVSVFAPGNGTTYVSQTFGFVADGSSVTLNFQDVSQNTQNTDLMLDHIVVTQGSSGAFTNGSFESNFANWNVAGATDIESAAPYVASAGSKLVVFNGGQRTPNGVLSQTFSTTPGQNYSLTFDAGAFSLANQSQQQMVVSVQGNGNSTLLAPQTVTVSAPGNGCSYSPQTFNFTADGPSTTVSFQDTSPTSQNVDLLLDNVQITPVGP